MQLGVFTLVAMYFTIWWVALFAVLPLGSKSHAEAGIEPPPGCDPGAPVKIDFKRKAITTTWVSTLIWAALVVIIESGWVRIPDMPTS
jgi:predicted secreted protein